MCRPAQSAPSSLSRPFFCAVFFVVASLLVCGCFAWPDSSDSYDFILYVVRWPGSTQTFPVPTYVDSFTLHGLWPTNNDSSYPSDCDPSDPFNPTLIKDLVPELNIAWFDYIDGPNSTDLWSHEWDKHGTCCKNVLPTEHDFFAEAINLHLKSNITATLYAQGIKPSTTTKYTMDQVVDAIRTRWPGLSPIITCATVNNESAIDEIQLCVDKNTFTVFECNSQYLHDNPTNCPSDGFYFPLISFAS